MLDPFEFYSFHITHGRPNERPKLSWTIVKTNKCAKHLRPYNTTLTISERIDNNLSHPSTYDLIFWFSSPILRIGDWVIATPWIYLRHLLEPYLPGNDTIDTANTNLQAMHSPKVIRSVKLLRDMFCYKTFSFSVWLLTLLRQIKILVFISQLCVINQPNHLILSTSILLSQT